MPALPLHLAPGILLLFMLALAVVPLAIIWVDERRRESNAARLVRLREAARLNATLAHSARTGDAQQRRGVRLPNI